MSEVSVKWPKVVSFDNNLSLNVNLGNGTMFRLHAFYALRPRHGLGLFLGLERIGCFTFGLDIFLHENYVAEKLSLLPADAANVADFLNAQLGIVERLQGKYWSEYMELSPDFDSAMFLSNMSSRNILQPEIIKNE